MGTASQSIQNACISKIEEETNRKDANVNNLVTFYREKFTDKPLLRLVQDLNQRVGIYANLLEDIKKQPDDSNGPDSDAKALTMRYEARGLIPSSTLPSSPASQVVEFVLEKVKSFGRALLEIITKYSEELIENIQIDPEVAVTFEMELSWKPTVTIGVERKGQGD